MYNVLPTIAPKPTEISRPFWEACREHRLIMQNCEECNKLIFFPSYMCPSCGGDQLTWKQLSGHGHIHSVTKVYHPAAPVFKGCTPYVVALIQVKEGPYMMSNIIGENALQACIGDAVQVEFQDIGDVTLPRYRLTAS